MGFDIPVEYIFTPPLAAVACMKNAGKHHCYLLTTGDVYRDFEQECIGDDTGARSISLSSVMPVTNLPMTA